MMKFDCAKVSGKVDYVRSVSRMDGGYKATVSIDGAVIPELKMSHKIYEELEAGESVILYGIFKNSSKKEKNSGVLYGLQTESGNKIFETKYRFQIPMFLAVAAAIAFCMVFLVGWFPSVIALIFLFGQDQNYLHNGTVLTTVEASLAALFFLWRAWVMFSATAEPEAWKVIAPTVLSSRFSKFHK